MRALSQTQAVLSSSEACERNKGPILAVLRTELSACRSVLEVGSGTGQHAVYFAAQLPHLIWQPSELGEALAPLGERIHLEGRANLRSPLALDVRAQPWPVAQSDAVFSANTLHIMAWGAVQEFFRGVSAALAAPGVLCVYGPFNYHGRYTSDSNAAFDAYLKSRDPESGIRDFEALDSLAHSQGLTLAADHAMPANNRTLVWRRAQAAGGARFGHPGPAAAAPSSAPAGPGRAPPGAGGGTSGSVGKNLYAFQYDASLLTPTLRCSHTALAAVESSHNTRALDSPLSLETPSMFKMLVPVVALALLAGPALAADAPATAPAADQASAPAKTHHKKHHKKSSKADAPADKSSAPAK